MGEWSFMFLRGIIFIPSNMFTLLIGSLWNDKADWRKRIIIINKSGNSIYLNIETFLRYFFLWALRQEHYPHNLCTFVFIYTNILSLNVFITYFQLMVHLISKYWVKLISVSHELMCKHTYSHCSFPTYLYVFLWSCSEGLPKLKISSRHCS